MKRASSPLKETLNLTVNQELSQNAQGYISFFHYKGVVFNQQYSQQQLSRDNLVKIWLHVELSEEVKWFMVTISDLTPDQRSKM